MPVTIFRLGNMLGVVGGRALEPTLQPILQYVHKEFFQGQELRERQRWLQEQMQIGAAYAMDPRLPAPDPRSANFRPELEFTTVPLYQLQNDDLVCLAGLKTRITTTLDANKIAWTFEDRREHKPPKADFARLMEIPGLTLRNKQDLFLAIVDTCDGGIVTPHTGWGKSFMARLLCVVYPKSRILFISPGLQVIRGVAKELKDAGIAFGIVGDGKYQPDARVVLCSADSLHRVPLCKFQLILGDEVHELAAPTRWRKLVAQATDAKWIGFTATHKKRADGDDEITEAIFGPVLLDVSYEEGVASKTATPLEVLMLRIPPFPEYSNGKTSLMEWKRLAYWRNDRRNRIFAAFLTNELHKYLPEEDPVRLVMVETIDHAFEIRQHLPDYPLVYAKPGDKQAWGRRVVAMKERGLWVEGQDGIMTDERLNTLRDDFGSGKLRKAIANHVWAQGVDFKPLTVLARLDGGTSKIGASQIPGRAARVYEGKSKAILIDGFDEFDPKAKAFSMSRIREYREHGWPIRTISTS